MVQKRQKTTPPIPLGCKRKHHLAACPTICRQTWWSSSRVPHLAAEISQLGRALGFGDGLPNRRNYVHVSFTTKTPLHFLRLLGGPDGDLACPSEGEEKDGRLLELGESYLEKRDRKFASGRSVWGPVDPDLWIDSVASALWPWLADDWTSLESRGSACLNSDTTVEKSVALQFSLEDEPSAIL